MLTFPDPNVETEYTDPNGSVWEFNGTGWVRQCDCDGSGGDGGGGSSPGNSVDWSLVKLLINGEGAEESNGTVDGDYADWDKTGNFSGITYTGSVKGRVTLTESKYGTGSVINGRAVVGQNPGGSWVLDNYNIGSESWTYEFWAKYNAQNQDLAQLCGKWRHNNASNRGWQLAYTKSTERLRLSHSPAGTAYSELDVYAPLHTFSDYFHVAVVYDADKKTFRVFVDGELKIEMTSVDPVADKDVNWHHGGIMSGTGWFGAFYDDVRLVIGQAVYTSNFTPPGELATSARTFSGDFVSRPWTDDSNEMGGDNDADLSNTPIQTNDSEEL